MIYNLSMHDFYKIILMQFLPIMFYKVLRQVWEYAILSDRSFVMWNSLGYLECFYRIVNHALHYLLPSNDGFK